MGPGLQAKRRLLAILSVFLLILVCLLVRVVYIQFLQNDFLVKRAYEQYNRNRELTPRRGTIYDRNMKELAISASVETVSVNPPEFKTKKDVTTEKVAEDLANILGLTKEDTLKKLTAKNRYEVLKRRVDKEVGDAVRKWQKDNDIQGINIDEDSKRFYPNKNLAAHVIGFTGSDNQGLSGIEMTMDEYLKGVKGKILSGVDAKGKELPLSDETHIEAQDGLNVVLTIDETIQHLAEKAMEKAIVDNKVQRGAMAVVMEPNTGDILAMVSKPDFDLNTPFAAPPGEDANTWKGTTKVELEKLGKTVWRNKVIMDTYEPGSTFKAITAAAGLEENLVTPDTPATDATVRVSGWDINCWSPNAHLQETFRQGVYNSCNPVFVRLSQKLGIERFYRYVKAFGFYDITNIELPGEEKSNFHAKPTEVNMATASFGQRFTITPLQLITAYSCIANGGKLLKPRLVKELTDSKGNVVKKCETEVTRNVISKETSDTLKDILEGVVRDGTGRNAYVPGLRIAGKTGTSETTEKNRYIASFSAIAPADDPQVCVLVIMDYPDVYPHTGGTIAAPLAGKLVEEILTYLEVERKYSDADKKLLSQDVFVPDLRNKTIDEAKKILKDYNLNYKIEADGNNNGIVIEQTPKPDAAVKQKSVVMLYTYKPKSEVMVKMPDLSNKTVDEASQTLAVFGLNIRVTGEGVAVSQKYKAGSEIPKGSVVDVEFRHLTNE